MNVRFASVFPLVALAVVACGSSPGGVAPAEDDGGSAGASAIPPPTGSDSGVGDGGQKGGADSGGDSGGNGGGDSGANGGGDAGADSGQDAGPTEFYSSFETGDPQPDWVSTVETDPSGQQKSSGVSGLPTTAILGSVMAQVAGVTASSENPPNEIAVTVADGDLTTKWLAFTATGYVLIELAQPVAVARYAISSANDFPTRDPKNWTLEGSPDASSWTLLDTQSNQVFPGRLQTLTFNFTNATPYLYYRLNILANGGDTDIQLSELQLSDGSSTPPSATAMRTVVGAGPTNSWNAKPAAGFTGLRALRFAGGLAATGRGYAYNKVFNVNLVVTPTSQLSYMLFPDQEPNDPNYPSQFAAVDLAFSDGTYLSDLAAADQSFAPLSPQGQGASRTLYSYEWNYKASEIGAVAAGKTIQRILVGYDNASGPAVAFGGWVDDIRITGNPAAPAITHLSDYAITTRGTNSSGSYSRGNNFPATAVPHGFNFWTPATDASSNSWLYTYHSANNAQNLPTLQAISLSHEPSPWMGDRQSFQVMPSTASGTPAADRASRALPFRHANEVARPYYYGVTLENGVKAEIAPTDHAAMLRFTFVADDASLVFDNADANAAVTLAPGSQALSGYSDSKSGLSAGATRLFFYASFDKPVTASGMLSGGGGAGVTSYYRFGVTAADRSVTMRIATSLLSVAQAQKNLGLEIASTDTFETVEAAAQKLWDDKFGTVQVTGASVDQLNTLYSNLYRVFLYPNSGFENTGTAAAPSYQYASPVAPSGVSTATQTGASVVSGTMYVNNGFWDTYRSAWPALTLLTPTEAGQMIDGFVRQYKDGGWVARWSSPGYANLMTGTSSNAAFADAYVKGVTNFDAQSAYDAAIKDATTPSADQSVGRNGLPTSIFAGYTSNATGAGLSWAMAGYLNDFAISNFSTALASNASDPRHEEFVENAEYFRNRAQNYVNLFDPSIMFFQGRNPSGAFAQSAASYDPRVWGGDYTETDGWNTAFDAPFDGQGLANLYGGNAALGAKLDLFFSTPETATFVGSYGGVIHEMLEAKDVRMGQLGLSNQPSYHIIYMYDFAGQPSKTQAKVRDALARLYVGSTIGQGYLGDEDNGAMSSWEVFASLGFYPLEEGSPNYAIGSPLFTQATVTLENGKTIQINAPNNSPANVYIQGLKVNGQPYNQTYITHAMLTAGATLDFDMGPTPSAWGTAPSAAPPSIETDSNVPTPLKDAFTSGAGAANASDGSNVAALFDDTSATQTTFTAANPSVVYHFASGTPEVTFYTLTSGTLAADPTGWTLNGSNNGTTWTAIDQPEAIRSLQLAVADAGLQSGDPRSVCVLPARSHRRERGHRCRGRADDQALGRGGRAARRVFARVNGAPSCPRPLLRDEHEAGAESRRDRGKHRLGRRLDRRAMLLRESPRRLANGPGLMDGGQQTVRVPRQARLRQQAPVREYDADLVLLAHEPRSFRQAEA